MPRYDPYEQIHKKRKGGGWNPTGTRRPPLNPQGNYSDLLPRITKDSTSSSPSVNINNSIGCGGGGVVVGGGSGGIGGGGTSSKTEIHSDTMRSNIHVVVRIRPKNFNEKGPLHRTIVKAVGDHVVIFDPKEDPSEEQFYFQNGGKQKARHQHQDYNRKPHKNMKFAYDRVYGPYNTNVEIFETSMKRLVSHIIDGFNCSIFAYGATGAGKTYTMLGSFEHPGLTFLMAMELYNRINGMANEYESEVVVSYLEVYNETLRDLLHPSGILSIREDGFNGVNIPNLTMHKPKDASELLGMLSYGNSVRTQHPTDHNAESSRSHAVFQVFVSLRKRFTQKSLKYKMAKAKLVMVDLAGSERGLGTGCDSQRFREGANINKSLLALSNCINALADGKKHIPYRDSKLTRILKDTLGGNCKTVMIANVSPSLVSYDDTYNTLKYAGRAKEIRLSCKKNYCPTDPGITYSKIVDDLQLEIQQLKSELQTVKEGRKKYEEMDINANVHHHHPDDVVVCHGGAYDNHHNNASPSRQSPPSPLLLTPTQVIPDPVALENFIQLLSQKKKLEEDHAEASVASKEMEWAVKWKRWKIEAAKFGGKAENPPSESALTHMKTQYENFLSKHRVLQEKVNLTKQVLEFNEKEIELASGNCLNKLVMEEPFLTVTLREFLFYKSLEREVSAHKALENYYQKMCLTIFEELLNSETMLGNCLKFHNYVYDCLQDRDGITEYIEAKQNELLSPLYGGEISLKISNTYLDQPEFPPTQLLQQLWDLMRRPVIEYEPSTAPLTTTQQTTPENGENDISSPGVQSAAFQSASVDTINDPSRSSGRHTPSLENSSATAASSSNDIVTIHHPRNYVSAESLLERGTTARTVPFSAAGSEDSAITEEAKTRTTTATDFEEAIRYSNSNLLQYMEQEAKREMKRTDNNNSNRSSSNNNSARATKTNRPGTTTVNKGQSYGSAQQQKQQQQQQQQHQQQTPPWLQNFAQQIPTTYDPSNSNTYYSSPRTVVIGDNRHGNQSHTPRVYDNAQVQVSEMDLVDANNEDSASRPLTYCYPNNYNNCNNDRIFPFYPGQGDR